MADIAKISNSLIQAGAGGTVIRKVIVRSQVTPEQEVQPFAPSEPAPPSQGGFSLMSLVKPEVEIQTAVGPYIIAPYGRPTENYFNRIAAVSTVGAVVALGLMAVGAVTVGKFLLRRS